MIDDIRKMFNVEHLKVLEQHCHHFLWRNLEQHRPPDVYVIQRENMGDKPAPSISTEAVYKTAELFHGDSPRAADLLKNSNYVDDLINSQLSKSEALSIANETEEKLDKGGFFVEYWQFRGDSKPRIYAELFHHETSDNNTEQSKQLVVILKGTNQNLRVLGLGWNPEDDSIIYEVTLNFSSKKSGVRTGPDLFIIKFSDKKSCIGTGDESL